MRTDAGNPPPRPLSVAFCGAAVGCGHGRAALAVRDALRVRGHSGTELFVDALDHADRWFASVYRDGYLRAIRHAPRLMGMVYDRTDVPRHAGRGLVSMMDRLQDRVLRRFRNHPGLHAADAVVSTHFLTTALLGRMRREGTLAVPLVTVVTDEHPHAVWLHRGSDATCVASPAARHAAIAGGLDPARVAVTGIPVDPRLDRIGAAAGLAGHRGDGSARVLVTGGGFGIGDIESTVAAILGRVRSVRVTVVCGRNAALERRMRSVEASRAAVDGRGNALEVVGYTKEMHRYLGDADLLVGKPGGLTTAEAKAIGLPMVLLRPIPGQEERNAQALVECGAAVRAASPEDAAVAVERLLAEPSALRAMAGAAAANGRPLAAFDVARRVADEATARGRTGLPRLVGMNAA